MGPGLVMAYQPRCLPFSGVGRHSLTMCRPDPQAIAARHLRDVVEGYDDPLCRPLDE
jgi:hypothetical protein